MELALTLISVGLTFISGILLYIIKQLNTKISEQAVRQLIEDKVGGIHSDLKEIKESINRLFALYIKIIDEKHR